MKIVYAVVGLGGLGVGLASATPFTDLGDFLAAVPDAQLVNFDTLPDGSTAPLGEIGALYGDLALLDLFRRPEIEDTVFTVQAPFARLVEFLQHIFHIKGIVRGDGDRVVIVGHPHRVVNVW